jgi:hypothetical protein
MGYVKTYSGACDSSGNVTVSPNQDAVCTVTNTVPFGTIKVNKVVVNDDGGIKTASNFTLLVIGNDITPVINGTTNNFAVGSYDITEQGVKGYQASFSGDCNSSGHLDLSAGENKVCTITNNDLPGNITLVKIVSGGSSTPTSFKMRVDGSIVPTGSSKGVSSNSAHIITEDPDVNYNFTSMTGTGDQGSSCPSVLGGSVTLHEGENITCTITNTAK